MIERKTDGYYQDDVRCEISDFRPGALWFDSRNLLWCKLPNGGCWLIDCPGAEWKRVGTPPNITVTPSIKSLRLPDRSDEYHGFLRNGILTNDLKGRKYDPQ